MALKPSAQPSGRQLYQGQPLGLATPSTAPTLALAANASSTLTAATYYVTYTWVYSSGVESAKSPEVSLAVTAGNQLNVTVPALPVGATGTNVYISSSAGQGTKQGTTANTLYVQSVPLVTGAQAPTSTPAGQLLYTAPDSNTNVTGTSSTMYLKEALICNTVATQGTFTLFVVPKNGTPSVANAICYQVPIKANDTKPLSFSTMVPPGGSIQGAQGPTSALTFTLSGTEVQ